jgi:hypothetical protein
MNGKQRIFRTNGFVAFHSFVADKFLKSRVWAFEIPNISTKIYVEPDLEDTLKRDNNPVDQNNYPVKSLLHSADSAFKVRPACI